MNRLPTLTERRKRISIETGLQKGKLLIHLDPRKADVLVPDEFRDQPVLGLHFSHHFPFSNTELGPLAISANLSFGGVRYACVVPYEAIFCLTQATSREQTWFSESLPSELQSWLSSGSATSEPEAADVDTDEERTVPFADRLTDTSTSTKKGPVLKLVE